MFRPLFAFAQSISSTNPIAILSIYHSPIEPNPPTCYVHTQLKSNFHEILRKAGAHNAKGPGFSVIGLQRGLCCFIVAIFAFNGPKRILLKSKPLITLLDG